MTATSTSITQRSLRLLLLSTSVGPLGSGLGGGVELNLHNIAQEMHRRGHAVKVVAPQGSILGHTPIVQIPGSLQTTAQTLGRNTPVVMPENSVLANMWEYARQAQGEIDLIFNIAYDWLPFYLTPFFNRPIAHFVSMGSLSEAMDRIIEQVAVRFPGTVGVNTLTQAATFPSPDRYLILGGGFDLSLYQF